MGSKVPPIRGFTDLTAGTFQPAIQDNQGLVMVEFYRDSCSSCHIFNATLLDIKDRLGDKVAAYRLNFDNYPDVAAKYRITGAPTTVFFHQGEVIGTIVGAMEMKYFIPMFAPVRAIMVGKNIHVSLD